MLVEDILNQTVTSHEMDVIFSECSEFINDSGGHPLFKNLPETYDDYQKVKVRLQKKKSNFTETFNQTFVDHIPNIRQRAIFAHGEPAILEGDVSLFYILPTNGYKFMYSKEVSDSNTSYKKAFDTILEQADKGTAEQLLADLLQYTYTSENLNEGIKSSAEIIIYNIPYYYAIRTDVGDYTELLTSKG